MDKAIKLMTQKQAMKAWARGKRMSRKGEQLMKAAEPQVKAYFEAHPEAKDYDGLIGIFSARRVQFDHDKLRQHFGAESAAFEKTISYTYLSLLVP